MMVQDRPGLSNGLTTVPQIDFGAQAPVLSDEAIAYQRIPYHRIILSVPGRNIWNRPAFVVYLEHQLNRLGLLRRGWDGAAAAAVTDRALVEAATILASVVGERTLLPQIFPLVDGGVQIEWHAGGDNIEVEVEGDGSIAIFAGRTSEDPLLEGIPGEDLPSDWLRTLKLMLGQMTDRARPAI
jgi:hypothetical protein